jgi:hypothetical protein
LDQRIELGHSVLRGLRMKEWQVCYDKEWKGKEKRGKRRGERGGDERGEERGGEWGGEALI